MAYEEELNALFTLKTIAENFELVLNDRAVTVGKIYPETINLNHIKSLFKYLSKIDRVPPYKNHDCDSLYGVFDSIRQSIEIELIVKTSDILPEIYKELCGESVEVWFYLNPNIQGAISNGNQLVVPMQFLSGINTTTVYNRDTKVQSGLSFIKDYLFKKWTPEYCWVTADWILSELLDKEDYSAYDRKLIETPWLSYNDTMIFGPQLVKSLNLKTKDWQHEDVYFAKWISDNILWLASPIGLSIKDNQNHIYGSVDSLEEEKIKRKAEYKLWERHKAILIEFLNLDPTS